MSDVLVLNSGYQPIACAPWETAIVWVLERIVEVIDQYDDRFIRTVNWQIKMPATVRFLKPIHRKRATKFSRSNIYLRDHGQCQYCGRRIGQGSWTYDHVIPRAQGGKTVWENVVVSCVGCNQRKGGRTPAQAGMQLLETPKRPKRLPDMPLLMRYHKGMHASWEDHLRNAVYWSGVLENDNVEKE